MVSTVSALKQQSPFRRSSVKPVAAEPVDRVELAVLPSETKAEAPRRSWQPSTRAALSLALVGLGVVGGGIHSAVAAPPQAQVKVAVIDNFDGPDSHGNLVDAVLHGRGLRLSHQIREDVTGIVLVESQREFEEFVTDLMQYLPARALQQVTAQLQKIARDPRSSVKTVNLSLAVNKAARFQLLEQVLKQDQQARERMQVFLGLPDTAGEQEFRQALVNKLENLFDSSAEVKQSQQAYRRTLDQLTKRNIVVVVAAGNEGELQSQLREQQVTTSPTFFHNLFASKGTTITVGAVDAQHRLWEESNPGADVLARGVGVPITIGQRTSSHDGTSFAAPQVARVIDQLKVRNPALTRDQILDLLLRTSDPVAGSGLAEVNPTRALNIAAATLPSPTNSAKPTLGPDIRGPQAAARTAAPARPAP